jgi:hypothetical protein
MEAGFTQYLQKWSQRRNNFLNSFRVIAREDLQQNVTVGKAAYIAQQCADSAAGCHVLALSNCVVVNLTQTMTIPTRLWMSVMLNR